MGYLRCLRLCTFAHSCQVRWKPGRRLKSEVEYGWSRLFFFSQVHLTAQVVSFSSLPIKKGWLGILRMGGGHHLVDADSVIVHRTNNSHILQILQFIHADLCDDESLFCLCLISRKVIESNPQYYVCSWNEWTLGRCGQLTLIIGLDRFVFSKFQVSLQKPFSVFFSYLILAIRRCPRLTFSYCSWQEELTK